MLSQVTASLLAGDRGYQVIQQLPGIGPVLAAVIIAEIGDVTRFATAGQLCSWAGLTPRHRESDVKVARGHITKQGSPMLRWAVIEAVQRVPRDSVIGAVKHAIIDRRGEQARSIAKVAAARRLLTLVFYGLRDGQIRCLLPGPPASRRPNRMTSSPGPRPGARSLLCLPCRHRRRGRQLDTDPSGRLPLTRTAPCPRPPPGHAKG